MARPVGRPAGPRFLDSYGKPKAHAPKQQLETAYCDSIIVGVGKPETRHGMTPWLNPKGL